MSANFETSPRHALQAEYERGFIDGMQEQMKRSVDRAVNAMAASAEAEKQEPVIDNQDLTIAYMSGFHDGKKKREWVGLTDDEIDQGLLRSDYALQTAHAWRAGVVFAMAKLKENNT